MLHNIRRLLGAPLLPLADLPNQPGFRFTGVLRDGTERPCVVTTRPALDHRGRVVPGVELHTVECFSELIGWRRSPSEMQCR